MRAGLYGAAAGTIGGCVGLVGYELFWQYQAEQAV
jgi:hypothetical protein